MSPRWFISMVKWTRLWIPMVIDRCFHFLSRRDLFSFFRWNVEFRIFDLQFIWICASLNGRSDVQEFSEVLDGRIVLLFNLVHANHRRGGDSVEWYSLRKEPSLRFQYDSWSKNVARYVEDESDDSFSHSVRLSALNYLWSVLRLLSRHLFSSLTSISRSPVNSKEKRASVCGKQCSKFDGLNLTLFNSFFAVVICRTPKRYERTTRTDGKTIRLFHEQERRFF